MKVAERLMHRDHLMVFPHMKSSVILNKTVPSCKQVGSKINDN